jgi:hypothetical protein
MRAGGRGPTGPDLFRCPRAGFEFARVRWRIKKNPKRSLLGVPLLQSRRSGRLGVSGMGSRLVHLLTVWAIRRLWRPQRASRVSVTNGTYGISAGTRFFGTQHQLREPELHLHVVDSLRFHLSQVSCPQRRNIARTWTNVSVGQRAPRPTTSATSFSKWPKDGWRPRLSPTALHPGKLLGPGRRATKTAARLHKPPLLPGALV